MRLRHITWLIKQLDLLSWIHSQYGAAYFLRVGFVWIQLHDLRYLFLGKYSREVVVQLASGVLLNAGRRLTPVGRRPHVQLWVGAAWQPLHVPVLGVRGRRPRAVGVGRRRNASHVLVHVPCGLCHIRVGRHRASHRLGVWGSLMQRRSIPM